jgi:superfamily II DNA or RNA helicase
MKADFVHSNLGPANEAVYGKLARHELDVIVQVRKLGEGFDHPYLAVAAVFSLFSNLSPFMQFVGRIMRIVPDTDPHSVVNEGVVVFHVGGNITGVWNDFREFADADQEFFANLVDEVLDERDPVSRDNLGGQGVPPVRPTVTGQEGLELESIELLRFNDPSVLEALAVLEKLGVTSGTQFEELKRIQPTKQAARQANRKLLDELVKTKVGAVLTQNGLSPVGRELDKTRRGKGNFQVIKAAIDAKIKANVPSKVTVRSDYSAQDLQFSIKELDRYVAETQSELFGE